MNTIAKQQPAPARRRIAVRIGELADALDGFPVEALITDCLGTADAELVAQAGMVTLIDRLLDQWIARLGHDIDQMPPLTWGVLSAISQRTHATRDALVEVQLLFDRLALPRAKPNSAAPGLWSRADPVDTHL